MIKHSLRKYAVRLLEDRIPYTAYEITEKEYIGRFEGSRSQLVDQLKERGYHYQLFAAEKQLDGEVDVGSYSRIPDRHPEAVHKTALDGRPPKECQYHVHLFEKDDHIAVYGHYEIHPYPWIPTWDWTRPYPQHYLPTWDRTDTPREKWTYLRGIADKRITPLLNTKYEKHE